MLASAQELARSVPTVTPGMSLAALASGASVTHFKLKAAAKADRPSSNTRRIA